MTGVRVASARRSTGCYERDTDLLAAAARNCGADLSPFLFVKGGPVYPMLKALRKEALKPFLSFPFLNLKILYSSYDCYVNTSLDLK